MYYDDSDSDDSEDSDDEVWSWQKPTPPNTINLCGGINWG